MNRSEAASLLGVSVDFFDDHVGHELPCVLRGRRRLYPVREIERWLERSSQRTGRFAERAQHAITTHGLIAHAVLIHHIAHVHHLIR